MSYNIFQTLVSERYSDIMNKRGIATKKLIKEKAYQLFAEKGFKEVTMTDVCEVTGLSRGGLYCHYENTDKIFIDIIDDLMSYQDEDFTSKIKEGLSAIKILDDVLERYKNEMIDRDASLSIAIYEYFSSRKIASEENLLHEQYIFSSDMWRKLIQYGIDKGEFNDVDISAIFDLIIFSYQGVRMYSKLMPIDETIPKRIIQEIRKLLVWRNDNDHRIS